jgi:hypothetical protein
VPADEVAMLLLKRVLNKTEGQNHEAKQINNKKPANLENG